MSNNNNNNKESKTLTILAGKPWWSKRSPNIIANDMFEVFNHDLLNSPDFATNPRIALTRAIINWIDEEIPCHNMPTASEVLVLVEFVDLADWFITGNTTTSDLHSLHLTTPTPSDRF